MLKTVRELGLLAVGVGLLGLLTSWLLAADNVLGNWLLAAFLAGHGWIHAMYLMPEQMTQPKAATATASSWPFKLEHSWLSTSVGAPEPLLRSLGRALVVLTVVTFALAALATIPLILPASLWQGLVLVGAVGSLALMTVFVHRSLVIGLAIDVVLIVAVLGGTWTP